MSGVVDTLHVLQVGLKEAALQIKKCIDKQQDFLSFLEWRAKLTMLPPLPSHIVTDVEKDIKRLHRVCARYCQSSECVKVTNCRNKLMFSRPAPSQVTVAAHMKQLSKKDIELVYTTYVRLFLMLDRIEWERQVIVKVKKH